MSTPRPRAAVAAVLITLTLPLTLMAAPAQAQSPDRYEDQARVVTNNKRDGHDLARFRKGACVQRFAERQARRMARQERMYHQDLGKVMRRCNLSTAGENVAYGYPTGRRVVQAWMRSQGHRRNILNGRFRLLGMAAARDNDGTMYAAQVFGRH
ncbi:CAP domain-containing protein [Nocardioides sp. GXQ0305]|uniref:CAP domain-containing protein n=1 Tax=Nocardioides sp. GXQ0305 TaxID=3423912 RepID=UPI003D7DC21A